MTKRSLGILGLYLLLALGFTYPLVLNLTSATPAGEAWTYDGFSMLWNLWWFKQAVLVLNANPFVTNGIFAPLGASLYLHTFTLFSDLVALPLLAWLSPVTSSNLILLVSLALCGYGMHLLMTYLLVEWGMPTDAVNGAALVAGVVFAFTTSRFVFLAQGHYNFVTTEWLPFYMLYLLKAVRGTARPARRADGVGAGTLPRSAGGRGGAAEPSAGGRSGAAERSAGRRSGAAERRAARNGRGWRVPPQARVIGMAALFLVLALLVELSLGVLLMLVTAFYALGRLAWSREGVGRRIAGLAPVALIMAVTALVSAPYLLPIIRETFDPRYIPQYWGGAAVLSADLVGLFTPSSLHTLFGSHDWPREWQQALENKSRFVSVNSFVIGFAVPGMALLGVAFQPRARRWLWLALALVVLALGPILHINGQSTFNLDGIPVIAGLPYVALHYLPVLNGLRVPQRFSVVAMLCFAVLAGAGAAWVLRRGQSRLLQGALLAVMLGLVSVEHLTLPLPLADARVPAVYERIAAEPGDFTVMDIPLGWRSGFGPVGTENTRLQYFQSVHGKRLISGFAARTPSFIFDYFKRQPVLNALATLESEGRLPPDPGGRDRAGAAELAYFYDLRYILIHPPAAAPTPYDATRQRVLDYVRSVFDIDEISRADDIIVYRVNQPAARAGALIDFGTDGSSLNRAEGWDASEVIGGATANWMTAPEARVFVPLRGEHTYRVTVRAMPFAYPGHPPQTLALRINGRAAGEPAMLTDAWSEYAFSVPADGFQAGLNEIMLMAPVDASPAEVLPGSSDTRRLRLAVDWIRVDGVPAGS